MFCRFCGKEIPDGSVCDCQKQAESVNNAENVQASAENTVSAAPAANSANVTVDIGGIKDIFAIAVTRPLTVIEYALANAQKTPQFIIGAIYAILMFLLPVIELNVVLGNYSKYFPVGKTAFLILLAAVLSRAVIAVVPFAATRGKKNIIELIALVCAATAFPCILRVILSVAMLIKWSPLIAVAFVVNACVGMVIDYETIKITTQRKNGALWLFVIAELITGLVVYLICRGVIQDVSNAAMGSLSMF